MPLAELQVGGGPLQEGCPLRLLLGRRQLLRLLLALRSFPRQRERLRHRLVGGAHVALDEQPDACVEAALARRLERRAAAGEPRVERRVRGEQEPRDLQLGM